MKNRWIGWLVGFAAVSFLAVGTSFAVEKEPFGMLSVDDVSKRLGEKDFHVFDSNPESAYLDGHVPGAPHVRFTDVSEKVLPKNKEATLVFYCRNPH